jgi:hypothetical protein
MDREAAKKLVTECYADAREEGYEQDENINAFAALLLTARLAPETPRKWEPAPSPYPDGSEGFMGPAVYDPDGKLVGEVPLPPFVPDGAPWEWTTLASGERVAMWVEDGEVRLFDPNEPGHPWFFNYPDEWDSSSHAPRIGPVALAAVEAFGRKHGVWK